MRTTLTLDEDVAAQVEQVRAETGRTLKEVVNEALRLGLRAIAQPSAPTEAPYRTPSESLGGCRIASLDDVAETLAAAEGEAFR